jgi:hypothetical protein
MNDFDVKWQKAAARARECPRREESAPFGFASRVLAAAAQPQAPAVSVEEVWQRLTWRSLAIVSSVLVICAAVEIPHLKDRKPFEPGIENTVAQLVWSL